MKKVVLTGGLYNVLLSPMWAVKFLEKKGYKNINAYTVEEMASGYDVLCEMSATNNSFFQRNSVYFSEKDLNEVRWIDLRKSDLIPYYTLISNREDKDLIEIAEQIPNNDIKIVEIPDDVLYEIKEQHCEEVIVEKSRTWS
ncbi:hypothetical protein EJM73_08730 [Clostridium botulinum]|uniref:hypothetical protein n=1 Tax=Clostridium botulinum TaxID=1491 RepID=UPI001375E012|nr:hypothetical protein [Clostridium botulinum]NCI19708.1 hypothetical protein [Clostridium botulinum]NCI35746.1 hypothetical protein [Clostridium botulinum]NCI71603.1 hypothetical protein [Clostridium botulinum]NDI38795.1 hypothetical protein [Clostridium botulinum]